MADHPPGTHKISTLWLNECIRLISSMDHRSLDRRQSFGLVRYLPNVNFRVAGHPSGRWQYRGFLLKVLDEDALVQ
jgi:hypothetical protein